MMQQELGASGKPGRSDDLPQVLLVHPDILRHHGDRGVWALQPRHPHGLLGGTLLASYGRCHVHSCGQYGHHHLGPSQCILLGVRLQNERSQPVHGASEAASGDPSPPPAPPSARAWASSSEYRGLRPRTCHIRGSLSYNSSSSKAHFDNTCWLWCIQPISMHPLQKWSPR